MKKVLLYLVAAILCFSSCKKDKKPTLPPTDTKKYSVKFNVSGFSQEITPGSGNKINAVGTNAITVPGVKKIFYYLYDSSNGTMVHSFFQDSTATNFGNVEDYLPAGTYSVTLIAGSKDLAGSTMQSNNPWTDTFYKSFAITVTGGDINQNIILDRIVGKLTVKLLDAIPANAAKMVITVDKDHNSIGSNASLGGVISRVFTTAIPASAIGTTNYTLSMLLLTANTDIIVDIKCYDAANEEIAHSVVSNVSVQPNTQTILSGNLFRAQGSGFSINLDKSWNTPVDIQF